MRSGWPRCLPPGSGPAACRCQHQSQVSKEAAFGRSPVLPVTAVGRAESWTMMTGRKPSSRRPASCSCSPPSMRSPYGTLCRPHFQSIVTFVPSQVSKVQAVLVTPVPRTGRPRFVALRSRELSVGRACSGMLRTHAGGGGFRIVTAPHMGRAASIPGPNFLPLHTATAAVPITILICETRP